MKILGATTLIGVDACSGTLDGLGSGPARVRVPLANPPPQAQFMAAAPQTMALFRFEWNFTRRRKRDAAKSCEFPHP